MRSILSEIQFSISKEFLWTFSQSLFLPGGSSTALLTVKSLSAQLGKEKNFLLPSLPLLKGRRKSKLRKKSLSYPPRYFTRRLFFLFLSFHLLRGELPPPPPSLMKIPTTSFSPLALFFSRRKDSDVVVGSNMGATVGRAGISFPPPLPKIE